MIIGEFLGELVNFFRGYIQQVPDDNLFGLLYNIGNILIQIVVGLFGGGSTGGGGPFGNIGGGLF